MLHRCHKLVVSIDRKLPALWEGHVVERVAAQQQIDVPFDVPVYLTSFGLAGEDRLLPMVEDQWSP